MEKFEKFVEVASALKEAGWEVRDIDFEHNRIIISRFYAIMDVYLDLYEKRISISEEHYPSNYRYVEGIKEEEFVPVILKLINEYRHENYRLTIVNEYSDNNGHDKFDERFFANEKTLLRSLTDDHKENFEDENIFTFEYKETQYPNPAIKLIIKRIKDNNDGLKQKYWQFKDSFMYELTRIEYKVDQSNPYKNVVTDEVRSTRTYYAFVTISDDPRRRS